jgi:endonuclease G
MQLFDVDRIKQAARRFAERTSPPIQARAAAPAAAAPAPAAPPAADARPAGAAPTSRPDRRKQYLAQGLARDRARATILEAEAHGTARTQRDTLRTLAQERIIGNRDLVEMNYLELAIAMAGAVCRIQIGSGAATGFLVGPRILATNHHVIGSRAEARRATAQFDYQENLSRELLPVQAFELAPDRFFLTDQALDFTLVGIGAASAHGRPIEDYPWVQLIGRLGKAEKGDPVNIIQHPRGDLKQIALRNNTIIEVPEGKRDFLYYTTDTEPGSSGSPCFNDQWELVALHSSGVPDMRDGQILKRDGTAWREHVDDPALIHWVANEGARVSAIVDALNAATLPAAEAELRARLLGDRPPNPVERARGRAQPARNVPADLHPLAEPGAPSAPSGGASVSLTVPLTITVSLGAAASGAPAAVSAAADRPAAVVIDRRGDVALTEAVVIDPDWEGRTGYDPRFLGVEIPLPQLSGEMKAKTVEVPPEFRRDGDRHALHYHHYSVAMHKRRRFAWYSAAIVDGDRRFKLPERDDRWFIDPRIDDPEAPAVQCGEELYASAKTDRGHLTRYLDVAWGDSKAEAVRSVNDTFHFTNCCLQLSAFNQGKDRWQGIERYLLEHKARREKRRMVVMTGPIFGRTDPVYRNPHMDYSIRIPVEFWKICALIRAEDDSLAATGFVLGQQDVADLPGFEEVFDVTATQVTLADLEERTGLRFGVLTEHDHFAAGGAPGALEIARPEGRRRIKPLRDLEDIAI